MGNNGGDKTSSRRGFLTTMLAAGAAPVFVPASVLGEEGKPAPSDKITLGVIGVGAQGQVDMRAFLTHNDVRVAAICDIEAAVRGDTLCQLALIAVKQGRKLAWDPQAERFLNDDGANAMLQPRAFRGEWRLQQG